MKDEVQGLGWTPGYTVCTVLSIKEKGKDQRDLNYYCCFQPHQKDIPLELADEARTAFRTITSHSSSGTIIS